MSKMILASTLNQRLRNPAPRHLYVVLSRLRSLSGLTLLQQLPPKPNYAAYALGKDIISELRRLADLERVTICIQEAKSLGQLFNIDFTQSVAVAAVGTAAAAGVSSPDPPMSALQRAYLAASARGGAPAASASSSRAHASSAQPAAAAAGASSSASV
jgi:hypothetical protein